MSREPQPTRQQVAERVANPFGGEQQRVVGVNGALVSVEQQRAIAEIQARLIIARNNPRNPVRCTDMILQECTRPSLAEKAEYQYARGGTDISGPSIRLAETISRHWGNIATGVKEVSRENGYSECVAYAWDLESGYFEERQFQIKHWRDTKSGGYAITDERDIYEMIANFGARRKRACLLAVIPGDVVEAAIEQCRITLNSTADTSPDAIKKMLTRFSEFGVTQKHIEARIQRRIESIRPAQVVELRRIYNSLKDAMSEPSDWFGAGVQAPVDAGEADGQPAEQQQQKPPAKASPQPAAPAFEAYVCDQTGEAIDGEVFTDPVKWASAYVALLDQAFPPDAAGIVENNVDARQAAMKASDEAMQIIRTVQVPVVLPEPQQQPGQPRPLVVPTRGGSGSQRDLSGYATNVVPASLKAEVTNAASLAAWRQRNSQVNGSLPPATARQVESAVEERMRGLDGGEQQQVQQEDPDDRQLRGLVADLERCATLDAVREFETGAAVKAVTARWERENPRKAESLRTALDARRSLLQRGG